MCIIIIFSLILWYCWQSNVWVQSSEKTLPHANFRLRICLVVLFLGNKFDLPGCTLPAQPSSPCHWEQALCFQEGREEQIGRLLPIFFAQHPTCFEAGICLELQQKKRGCRKSQPRENVNISIKISSRKVIGLRRQLYFEPAPINDILNNSINNYFLRLVNIHRC